MATRVLPSLLFVALLAASNLDAVTIKKLPSFLRKCSVKDPDILNCILEHAREALPHIIHGDPELRLPKLDPLSVPEIRIQTGSEPSSLDLVAKNIIITGLADVDFRKLESNETVYRLTVFIPHFEITSDYVVDGRVLLLPIKGNGKANFTFDNAMLFYTQPYAYEKKGDYTFFKLHPSSATFNCTRAHFRLDNLFNGDKQLGNTVNTFLDENWKEIIDDIGQPFVDAAAAVIRQFALGVVGNVPLQEVFDDVPPS